MGVSCALWGCHVRYGHHGGILGVSWGYHGGIMAMGLSWGYRGYHGYHGGIVGVPWGHHGGITGILVRETISEPVAIPSPARGSEERPMYLAGPLGA